VYSIERRFLRYAAFREHAAHRAGKNHRIDFDVGIIVGRFREDERFAREYD
jgi:hypothetical protein